MLTLLERTAAQSCFRTFNLSSRAPKSRCLHERPRKGAHRRSFDRVRPLYDAKYALEPERGHRKIATFVASISPLYQLNSLTIV
jgi:hypothetical protein